MTRRRQDRGPQRKLGVFRACCKFTGVRTQDAPVVRRASFPRSTDARVRKRRAKTADRVVIQRGSGAERRRLSATDEWSVDGGTLSHLTMGVSSRSRSRRSCWGRETPPAHAGGIQFHTCVPRSGCLDLVQNPLLRRGETCSVASCGARTRQGRMTGASGASSAVARMGSSCTRDVREMTVVDWHCPYRHSRNAATANGLRCWGGDGTAIAVGWQQRLRNVTSIRNWRTDSWHIEREQR